MGGARHPHGDGAAAMPRRCKCGAAWMAADGCGWMRRLVGGVRFGVLVVTVMCGAVPYGKA